MDFGDTLFFEAVNRNLLDVFFGQFDRLGQRRNFGFDLNLRDVARHAADLSILGSNFNLSRFRKWNIEFADSGRLLLTGQVPNLHIWEIASDG